MGGAEELQAVTIANDKINKTAIIGCILFRAETNCFRFGFMVFIQV